MYRVSQCPGTKIAYRKFNSIYFRKPDSLRIASRRAGMDNGTSTRAFRSSKILIAGLGNVLFGDEGVGVHAIRCFKNSTLRTCLAVEIGTALRDAVPLLENFNRILFFDALKAGGKPGSIYQLDHKEILERGTPSSLHRTELSRIYRALSKLRVETALIAAEPEKLDWGADLSPSVEAAVPTMVWEACRIIADWRGFDTGIIKTAGSRPLAQRLPAIQELRLVG
jgi:hydrogenase maturation protease